MASDLGLHCLLIYNAECIKDERDGHKKICEQDLLELSLLDDLSKVYLAKDWHVHGVIVWILSIALIKHLDM